MKSLNYDQHQCPETICDISLKCEIDDFPDLSWLGIWTSEYPGDDMLKRHSAFDRNPDLHEYKYFIPGISVEEHRRSLSKMGYSKGNAEYLARCYCRHDWKRAESYGEDWVSLGFIVTVTTSHGAEFTDNLWGIESDATREYHIGIINDMIGEIETQLPDDIKNGDHWENMVNEFLENVEIEY